MKMYFKYIYILQDNLLNMKINVVYLMYAAYVEYCNIRDMSNGTLEVGAIGQFIIPSFFFFFVSF